MIEHMSYEMVGRLVDQVAYALEQLREVVAEPSALPFHELRPEMERLETAMNDKALIDASFAWLADLHDAGRVVGSSSTTDYLVEKLGVSRMEARERLQQGASLFDPVEGDSASAVQVAAREKDVSSEKRRIINTEIKRLKEESDVSPTEIMSLAFDEAETRSVEDTRQWVQEKVNSVNKTVVADRKRALRNRAVSFSRPDAEGGVRLHGYLPAHLAALAKSVLDPMRSRTESEEDTRTIPQRRADLFEDVLTQHSHTKKHTTRGVVGLVVSMTVDDIDTMSAESLFPTHTGDTLTPWDLLRLGAAQHDYLALHNEHGQPLALAHSSRTASLQQRIALFAAEYGCTHPGCEKPLSETEVHHIQAWSKDGPSSLDNLTLLCWYHHRDNCDDQDGRNGFGHAEKDPDTGQTGHRRARSNHLEFNKTTAHQRSNGAKIRRRRRHLVPE